MGNIDFRRALSWMCIPKPILKCQYEINTNSFIKSMCFLDWSIIFLISLYVPNGYFLYFLMMTYYVPDTALPLKVLVTISIRNRISSLGQTISFLDNIAIKKVYKN